MSFVNPAFLYALSALAVPIIIHLFNFRKYKTVYFTNVKFLRELKQESQSKSRLKEILILISRLLTITCLVLAFAQPFIPSGNNIIKKGNNAVAVYIDNSFSMEGVNKNGSLLANARKRAKEIVNAFGNADRFMLLTNDFEGKHQRLLSKEEINDAIDEVKISASVKQVSSIIKRQNDILKSGGTPILKQYIISDFQKNMTDFSALKSDSLVETTFIPISSNTSDNIYIDTCWFDSPVQQKGLIQKLNVRVFNKSKTPIENASVKLFVNGVQTGIASFNAEAQSKAEAKISFECKTEGFNYCSLKLDDYPIVFDDELLFTFNSKPGIKVYLINGKNSETAGYFTNLLNNDSLFLFSASEETSIDFGKFSACNLAILNEVENFSSGLIAELNKFMSSGGHIVFIPEKSGKNNDVFFKQIGLQPLVASDTSQIRIEKTDFKTGFYEGVFEKIEERIDLPLVKKRFIMPLSNYHRLQPILKLLNGETWLGELKLSNSTVYVFSGPLNISCTNFLKHALFVPTFYKMGLRSLKPLPPYYFTRNNEVIQIGAPSSKSEVPYHLKEINGKKDVIPETRAAGNQMNIYTQSQISEPGFFNLELSGQIIQAVAFNHNRLESDLEFYSNEDLENNIINNHLNSFTTLQTGEKSITSVIQETRNSTKLWKLFIILTLVFAAAEIAIIRLIK